jgi:hypothetical protein
MFGDVEPELAVSDSVLCDESVYDLFCRSLGPSVYEMSRRERLECNSSTNIKVFMQVRSLG